MTIASVQLYIPCQILWKPSWFLPPCQETSFCSTWHQWIPAEKSFHCLKKKKKMSRFGWSVQYVVEHFENAENGNFPKLTETLPKPLLFCPNTCFSWTFDNSQKTLDFFLCSHRCVFGKCPTVHRREAHASSRNVSSGQTFLSAEKTLETATGGEILTNVGSKTNLYHPNPNSPWSRWFHFLLDSTRDFAWWLSVPLCLFHHHHQCQTLQMLLWNLKGKLVQITLLFWYKHLFIQALSFIHQAQAHPTPVLQPVHHPEKISLETTLKFVRFLA